MAAGRESHWGWLGHLKPQWHTSSNKATPPPTAIQTFKYESIGAILSQTTAVSFIKLQRIRESTIENTDTYSELGMVNPNGQPVRI